LAAQPVHRRARSSAAAGTPVGSSGRTSGSGRAGSSVAPTKRFAIQYVTVKTAGTNTSDSTVDIARPPITAIAISDRRRSQSPQHLARRGGSWQSKTSVSVTAQSSDTIETPRGCITST